MMWLDVLNKYLDSWDQSDVIIELIEPYVDQLMDGLWYYLTEVIKWLAVVP
jgi:hypothetical protein